MAEPQTPSKKLFKERLSDQVVRILRSAIDSGDLRSGAFYSARALATELAISPAPVRQALLDLESEGLIEIYHNVGFCLKPLFLGDVEKYVQIQEMLEIPAMAHIVRAAPQRLEALPQHALEAAAAAEREDLQVFLEADRRFHLGLLSLTGNARLMETVGGLHRRRSRICSTLASTPAELVVSARLCLDAVGSLLVGDSEAAKDVLSRHFEVIANAWSVQPAE